jgi:hypothetical protein
LLGGAAVLSGTGGGPGGVLAGTVAVVVGT